MEESAFNWNTIRLLLFNRNYLNMESKKDFMKSKYYINNLKVLDSCVKICVDGGGDEREWSVRLLPT